MDKEKLLEKINTIGTSEDEAERRSLLDSLRDEIGEVFDRNHELEEQNNKYSEANESLRSANMDLFLQLGQQKSKGETIHSETGEEPPKEKRNFENLFDEKGAIK